MSHTVDKEKVCDKIVLQVIQNMKYK